MQFGQWEGLIRVGHICIMILLICGLWPAGRREGREKGWGHCDVVLRFDDADPTRSNGWCGELKRGRWKEDNNKLIK